MAHHVRNSNHLMSNVKYLVLFNKVLMWKLEISWRNASREHRIVVLEGQRMGKGGRRDREQLTQPDIFSSP
jgi:hypothetical protein